MASVQVLGPYLFERSLQQAERYLRVSGGKGLRSEARDELLALLPTVRHIVTLLHRCHLTVFYMQGLYYHLSKRFTNITYVRRLHIAQLIIALCETKVKDVIVCLASSSRFTRSVIQLVQCACVARNLRVGWSLYHAAGRGGQKST